MRFPIRFFPDRTDFDFMRLRWVWFGLSLALTAATVALLLARGLNLGIDFTGGVLMEVRTERPADLAAMRTALGGGRFGEVSLQNIGGAQDVLVRIQAKGDADQARVAEEVKALLTALSPGGIEFRRIDYVGPTVGRELIEGGVLSILIAFALMMAYIWFRFEWQFGIGGIAALLHDAVLVVGFYLVTQLEFGLSSIAAILTIVGYSINDSVVIYDRIRENMRKFKQMPMETLINRSVNDTLSRTVMTAGTVALAALALVLFGGETLKGFSAAMLFGVVAGTYSSIYISAPLLIYFRVRPETGEDTPTAARPRGG